MLVIKVHTAEKMKLSIKDFFSKSDQILRKLQTGTHLLKKSLMENFLLCAVMYYHLFELFDQFLCFDNSEMMKKAIMKKIKVECLMGLH